MRAFIYDRLISRLTAGWYREVLDRLPAGTRLLDVGIGTARPLCAHADLLRSKDISVVGVDIDAAYLERARRLIARAALTHLVQVRHESIYDHQGGPYDAAYFSGSFMLMPEPARALEHVQAMLADGGRVYFTQTFSTRRSGVLEKVKPLLKTVTTIDFGRVTYERDFRVALDAARLDVVEMHEMSRAGSLSHRLVVAGGRPGRGHSRSMT